MEKLRRVALINAIYGRHGGFSHYGIVDSASHEQAYTISNIFEDKNAFMLRSETMNFVHRITEICKIWKY